MCRKFESSSKHDARVIASKSIISNGSEKRMAIIKDRSFGVSKTSMELKVVETDSVSSTINIMFNCGNHHLDYTFFVLRSDLMMLHTLILRNWDDLLEAGVWDSTDPSFSLSISTNKSELIEEQIYQFQCWIDAGEYMSSRSTRSGIGITIYQDQKTIEDFALQLKHELD